MRNLIIIMFVLLFSNCNGYQPIFDSSGLNFYLKEITLKDDSSISRHLSKRLEPLRSNTEKKPFIIEIKSSKTENVISRDSKGDPSIFELIVEINIEVLNQNPKKKFSLKETSNYDNQQNKFELEQYKQNLTKTLTDNIAEKLITRLRETD
jgi:hypothetical protein